MKKKGFTLVELLAVIVILAIILVIAVPQIISTINESRRGALVSSAKLIASTAESMYLANNTLGIEQTITCEDAAELTPDDYASCNVTIEGGEAKVTIVGKGKFEGMNVCSGTKVFAKVTEDSCPVLAVQKITTLANNTSNTEGLEKTSDGNIRYTGSTVKNYVEFNNETWRIIGVFEVTKSNGTKEKLVKIVRDVSFRYMSWDSSAGTINAGRGVNEWNQADLQTMLNTYYLGTSTICTYCSSRSKSTCTNDCSSTVTPISSTYTNMIEEVKWNTGAITLESSKVISVETTYEEERGTTTGKICTSGTYCNDTVERRVEWTGKVGLIYPSDYGYASTDTSCRANIYDYTNTPCKNSNWLHNNLYYWTLSPDAYSSYADFVYVVYSSGCVSHDYADVANGVRPAVYLKSSVQITGGDGSSESPYKLSL